MKAPAFESTLQLCTFFMTLSTQSNLGASGAGATDAKNSKIKLAKLAHWGAGKSVLSWGRDGGILQGTKNEEVRK